MNARPQDHAIRERALDATRSFIVEAPAGSGKTELLTRRFLRLLARVSAPEEVLAITFTRKAANEMRNRILNALSAARSASENDELDELAHAVHRRDGEQDWQLLEHPNRLRIMTIDALNTFLAKQLPLLSGTGASSRIASDAQQLYAETALRVAERLAERSEIGAAVARLLKHLDNRYDVFESLLAQELTRREHWLDLGLMRFDLSTLRSRLEVALRQAVGAELAALCERIPREQRSEIAALAAHAGATLNQEMSLIAACHGLTEFPEAVPEVLAQWRGIAELLLRKDGEWRAQVDKRVGFAPDNKHMKQRMTDLLERLCKEPALNVPLHRVRHLPEPTYSDAQWRSLTDLLTVLKLAIAELEVVMRDRGEADYPALAIAARRALGSLTAPTDLALRLDYRVSHILVDEFQDTSRGQVELLALLTAGWTDGDGRTLFCVGDPMQSIYRFRKADVGLFLNLKRQGLSGLALTPLRLAVNFRSSQPVLKWVNSTFARIFPSRDEPERGAVSFAASEPRVDAPGDGTVRVHPIVASDPIIAKSGARALEAKRIAELIAARRSGNPNARIAVLVSNRLHLRFIVQALRARGIEFNAVEIDALIERPAVQDLIALTRSLVHLADRTAWLSVLRAPWCGLSLTDLHAVCGDSPGREAIWTLSNDAAVKERLSSDGRHRLQRVLPVLQRGLAARGRMPLHECVERTWTALGGPATLIDAAALGDCQTFFERLAQIERRSDLEDVARLEELLDDLYASSASADAKVELMTIHRAKGLEFDVVILPGLDSGGRGDDPPLLRTQELPQMGESSLLIAPIAARGSEADPIYAWLGQTEKDRARFEKARLLYVAATRAECELHMFGAVVAGGTPRANTFLELLWPVVKDEFAACAPEPAVTEKQAKPTAIRTRRLPLAWQAPAPEQAFDKASLRVVDEEPLHPEFEWASETARHVGTVVHREIERLARDSAESIREDGHRYLRELAELGVPPHLRQAAAERVTLALRTMLADARGQWLLNRDRSHGECASEFAVSGLIDAEIVNGVVDRTFVDRDGVRWIVDFKTSAHEGGGIEGFLTSEIARYAPQLRRYARLMRALKPQEAVRAALYFPLLGAWREVELG